MFRPTGARMEFGFFSGFSWVVHLQQSSSSAALDSELVELVVNAVVNLVHQLAAESFQQ